MMVHLHPNLVILYTSCIDQSKILPYASHPWVIIASLPSGVWGDATVWYGKWTCYWFCQGESENGRWRGSQKGTSGRGTRRKGVWRASGVRRAMWIVQGTHTILLKSRKVVEFLYSRHLKSVLFKSFWSNYTWSKKNDCLKGCSTRFEKK